LSSLRACPYDGDIRGYLASPGTPSSLWVVVFGIGNFFDGSISVLFPLPTPACCLCFKENRRTAFFTFFIVKPRMESLQYQTEETMVFGKAWLPSPRVALRIAPRQTKKYAGMADGLWLDSRAVFFNSMGETAKTRIYKKMSLNNTFFYFLGKSAVYSATTSVVPMTSVTTLSVGDRFHGAMYNGSQGWNSSLSNWTCGRLSMGQKSFIG